jgi:hypothetical protein
MIIPPARSDRSHIRWGKLLQWPQKKQWVDQTLLQIGYPDLKRVNAEILRKTNELSTIVKEQSSPVFLLKSQSVTRITKNRFEADGLTVFSRKWCTVASMLKGAGQLCCFGMNLGHDIEITNKALIEKSLIQGVIWDALCSTLAEYYADRIQSYLAYYYQEKGLHISRRFSPGYCDLPLLQTQKALFRFCGMARIGMQLSSAGLMTPRKSITGMVLAAEKVPLTHPCSTCKSSCPYRRADDETI